MPAEGVVFRYRAVGHWSSDEETVAELDLPHAAHGWVFEPHPRNVSWSFAVVPAGQPVKELVYRKASHELDLEPGRYRVHVRWGSDRPSSNENVTFSVHPPTPDPLLHASIPAEVKEKERVLELWFPFARSLGDDARIKAAPPSLFVYAGPRATADLVRSTNSDWDDGTQGARITLIEGEPLLNLGDGTYLATDLSRITVPSAKLGAAPGPVTMPKVPRVQWKMFPVLVQEVDGPLQAEGKKLLDEWAEMKACQEGAARWLRLSTTNVILTPASRAAIDTQFAAMRATCKTSEVMKKKGELVPRVLQTWREQYQTRVESVQAALRF